MTTGEDVARSGELAAKLERVRAVLRQRGDAGAALITRRNFAWLTAGGDNHVLDFSENGLATILVTADDVVVLTTIIEAARVRDEEVAGLPVEVIGLPWERPEALAEEIRRRVRGTVADDAMLEEDLRPLRMVLTPAEQARLSHVGNRTSRAVTRTLAGVRPGDLETVVAKRLDLALAAEGIVAPIILVASDERIPRYRHPIPKPKPIVGSVMLVVGAEQGGLTVAMTRIAWLGRRPDPDIVRRHAAATRVHAAFRQATRVGATLGDVMTAGIAAYRAEGFDDEWRLHHQGGPIGYQGRELLATPTSASVIGDGMAFAWNPSITGTKVEDTLILQGDRQVIVTRDPDWPVDEAGEPAIWARET
jgi:Xaa-Pro dipeptidase